MHKRLVVNADDFGLDSAINDGIIEAFRKGIVTNTSLLVSGSEFEEAVEAAKKYSGLGVGIHLSLNEERSVLPRNKIKTLLIDEGNYFLDYPGFLKRFLRGKIFLNEVYLELEAQIEKFMKTGLKPTHLDSHKHIHLIPKISKIIIELARKFGISRIRLSRESLNNIIGSRRCFRAIAVFGLSTLATLQLKNIKKYTINTPHYCYGLAESGSLTEERLTKILRCLPAGTNELICHPGFTTAQLLNRYKWNYSWLTELRALTNPDIRSLADNLNIQLIKYDEI